MLNKNKKPVWAVLFITLFILVLQVSYGAEIVGHLDDPVDAGLDDWVDTLSA